jgi:hypothetical protein
VHESGIQRVRVVGRRLNVAGDEDGYDERVDGQDTRHDNGDQRLAMLDGPLAGAAAWRTFMIRSGLYVPMPAMPMPALAVP